jgi:hypothetical protein
MVMFLLSLGLDACGAKSTAQNAQSTPSTAGTLAIATSSPDINSGLTAEISGTMRGTVNSDRTACFRMAEEPNLPMVWPAGYSASTDPLRVVDRLGKTVAVDGQHVSLAGGTADLGTSQAILGCGNATQVLLAG